MAHELRIRRIFSNRILFRAQNQYPPKKLHIFPFFARAYVHSAGLRETTIAHPKSFECMTSAGQQLALMGATRIVLNAMRSYPPEHREEWSETHLVMRYSDPLVPSSSMATSMVS